MDIANLGIAAVPAITVICLLVCQIVKATKLDNKFLPGIAGVVGGILGVVALKLVPDFPATDFVNAAAIGIVSGLAATGINQIYKQLNNSEK